MDELKSRILIALRDVDNKRRKFSGLGLFIGAPAMVFFINIRSVFEATKGTVTNLGIPRELHLFLCGVLVVSLIVHLIAWVKLEKKWDDPIVKGGAQVLDQIEPHRSKQEGVLMETLHRHGIKAKRLNSLLTRRALVLLATDWAKNEVGTVISK